MTMNTRPRFTLRAQCERVMAIARSLIELSPNAPGSHVDAEARIDVEVEQQWYGYVIHARIDRHSISASRRMPSDVLIAYAIRANVAPPVRDREVVDTMWRVAVDDVYASCTQMVLSAFSAPEEETQ